MTNIMLRQGIHDQRLPKKKSQGPSISAGERYQTFRDYLMSILLERIQKVREERTLPKEISVFLKIVILQKVLTLFFLISTNHHSCFSKIFLSFENFSFFLSYLPICSNSSHGYSSLSLQKNRQKGCKRQTQ